MDDIHRSLEIYQEQLLHGHYKLHTLLYVNICISSKQNFQNSIIPGTYLLDIWTIPISRSLIRI